MSDERWIQWSSGAQPVDDEQWVEVKLGTGRTNSGPARCFGRKYQGREIGWRRVGDKYDIIAYRVISPPLQEDIDHDE